MFIKPYWADDTLGTNNSPADVRGVAGSKTMCNQRTSAKGLGDA